MVMITFWTICHDIAGVVDKPADLDVATVMAMGFPPYRGGLIFWADLVGAERICARLEEWAAAFAPVGLDGFFRPSAYLRKCATNNLKLESGVSPPSKL